MAAPQTELAKLYGGVMTRLTMMLRVARDAGGVSDGNRAFVTRQLRRLAADLTRIEALETELVSAIIRPTFESSTQRANASIRDAGFQLTKATATSLEVETLRQLETRITRDLANVRVALGEALALNDPIRRGPQAVADALKADGAVQIVKGEAKVRVPSGRNWDLKAYSKMLTRTAVADARREAFRTRYLANGLDVVYVVPNGTEHEVCRVWEGRLLSLTGGTGGLPTVDEARAAGLFHPQCRHRYVAATPERLEDAGVTEGIAPIPNVSLRESLNRVAPTPVRSTLGRAAPGVPTPTPRRPRGTPPR